MENSKKSKKVKGIDPNFDYQKYWEERYKKGQNSGAGSYGSNADFKAQHVNKIIDKYQCVDMVDYGCGDGNQLSLFTPIPYMGLDVSATIIRKNEEKYKNDRLKKFGCLNMKENVFELPSADLVTCLDVLFHVCKEEDWLKLIDMICNSILKVGVIITNTEEIEEEYFPHVNFKRKILPVLSLRDDVVIDEVITQHTHPESNIIILRKV